MSTKQDLYLIVLVLLLTSVLVVAGVQTRLDVGSHEHGSIYNTAPEGASSFAGQWWLGGVP